MQKTEPCSWFDDRAEEVAKSCASVFKSKVGRITRHGKEGKEIHGHDERAVLAVEVDIHGQTFTLHNGGPLFKFNESVSFRILCDDQKEVGYYREKLGQGSDPNAQQCGWLKDEFGLSWQAVPNALTEMLKGKDQQVNDAVMKALLRMKTLDITAPKKAYNDGEAAPAGRRSRRKPCHTSMDS